ncbi:trypsin-like serine peptidase [Roseibium sp. SCP14]|uniref:trypsin-like serine peptidase n=1 Tax=Roseibium sp. SCP14 TaxID=3141375 RepID=UPI003335E403
MRFLKLACPLKQSKLLLWASIMTAALLIATTSVSAPAADPELKVIDSTDFPWRSIGRVNFAGYRTTSMCTGTLVAPKVVLTAAHCLYHARTRKPLPVEDVLFIAGVRRDEYAARLEADCILTPEGFVPEQRPKIRDIHNDFGLIILKEKSALPPVLPLETDKAGQLSKATRFQAVGYRRSRRFLPTVVTSCKILGAAHKSWVTDCATENGASGGPLLLQTPDGLRVAGLTSAKIDDQRSAIVPFLEWRTFLENASCTSGAARSN